jgi:hypothetical protein
MLFKVQMVFPSSRFTTTLGRCTIICGTTFSTSMQEFIRAKSLGVKVPKSGVLLKAS